MNASPSPAVDSSCEQRLECGRLALRAAETILSGPFASERIGAVLLALVNVRAAVQWLAEARRASASAHSTVSPEPLEADVRAVLERSAEEELSAEPSQAWKDLELLRAYGERLLFVAEEPVRRARAARRRARVRGLALPVVAFLLVAGAAWWLFRSRDVSAGKPWTTSSTLAPCDPIRMRCAGVETSILFHTLFESEPWFEVDLGAVHEITQVAVRNRRDYCPECALPLIVETSLDKKRYRTVARKFATFDDWQQRFSATRARYVRLRVTRASFLHLEAVRVFGRRLD